MRELDWNPAVLADGLDQTLKRSLLTGSRRAQEKHLASGKLKSLESEGIGAGRGTRRETVRRLPKAKHNSAEILPKFPLLL